MITAEAIEKDLKRVHQDFGESNLFDGDGNRVHGFFMIRTAEPESDMPGEVERILRSATEQSLDTRITDRIAGRTWRVKKVWGEEGSYYHQLEDV